MICADKSFFRDFEGKPERLSPRRAIFQGTHNTQSHGFTLSVSQGIGKLSEKAKSVVFAFSRNYLNKLKARLKTTLFKKRTQFAAYLRLAEKE